MSSPSKVLFIAGDGRSGSTLLERLLGRHPAMVPVGELKQIWTRSFLEDQLCSCGAPFSDCPFWARVRASMGEGTAPAEMAAAQQRVDRIRHLPRLVRAHRAGRPQPDLQRLRDASLQLYRAIASVAGAPWVVDASKHPQTAWWLAPAPGLELHLLHLVRDVRGVAWSWQKRRIRPEIIRRTAYMPRYGTLASVGNWLLVNRLAELAGTAATSYRRVRYEDLIARPAATLNALFAHLGLEQSGGDIVSPRGEVELALDHTVSGNPLRFRTGLTLIRNDDAWQQAMPRSQQRLIRLLAWPLLRRYGY
jgi:hypothetical protein